MHYEVNVLTPCENEEEIAVVIAAALTAVNDENSTTRLGYNLVVRDIRRIQATAPVWGRMARHERFERKFNT
jgi:hypothetical protein